LRRAHHFYFEVVVAELDQRDTTFGDYRTKKE
jgi:hypothetical protein